MKTKTKAIAFVLVSMFLSMSLVIQPVSNCPSKSELRLEIAVNPGSVYQYHLVTLQASLENYAKVWGGNPMKVSKAPIPGIVILFSIVDENGGRTPIGGNLTGIDGVSSLSFVATQHPGHYWVEAQMNASATLIARKSLQVLQAPLSIQFESLGSVWGVNSTIRARVTTRDNHPVHCLVVEVSIYASGVWRSLGNATTGHNGTFSITAFIGYPPGLYDLKVGITGHEHGGHDGHNEHGGHGRHNGHNEHGGNNGHNEHGGNNGHNEHGGMCGRDGLGNYFFPRWLEVRKRVTTISTAPTQIHYKDPATLDATLLDELGIPVVMSNITFTIQVGGNWELIGQGSANYNGIVSVSFVAPLILGVYPFKAEFAGDAYYLPSSGQNTLTIMKEYSIITEDFSSLEGRYSDQSTISAWLTDDDFTDAIPGAILAFSLSYDNEWYDIGSAITDGDGLAQLSYTPLLPMGSYRLNISYVGNPLYEATSTGSIYGIQKEDILISFPSSAPRYVYYGDSVWLEAVLTDDEQNPIVVRTIQFYVQNDGNWIYVGSGETDDQGIARCYYTANNIDPGLHLVKILFDGDAYYIAGWCTDPATGYKLIPVIEWVSAPTDAWVGESVTYHVRVTDPVTGALCSDVPVSLDASITNPQEDPFGKGDVSFIISVAFICIMVAVAVTYATEYYESQLSERSTQMHKKTFLGVGIVNFDNVFYPAPLYLPQHETGAKAVSKEMENLGYIARTLTGSVTKAQIIAKYNQWWPTVFLISTHGVPDELYGYGLATSATTYDHITNRMTYTITSDSPLVSNAYMKLAYLDACQSSKLADHWQGLGAKAVISYAPNVDADLAHYFKLLFFEKAVTGISIGTAYDDTKVGMVTAFQWLNANIGWIILFLIFLGGPAALIAAIIGAGYSSTLAAFICYVVVKILNGGNVDVAFPEIHGDRNVVL